MNIALTLAAIAGFVLATLAVCGTFLWLATRPDQMHDFDDEDLAVACRVFIDDAQTGRFDALQLTQGQFNAYMWLQEHE